MPQNHTPTQACAWSLKAITIAAAALSAAAHAGPPNPRADLQVELNAPATVDVNLPTTYSVTVTNLGGQTSNAINARVTLPLTNTSPQVFVLGTVSGLDPRCSVVAKVLNCSLAALRKGWSTTFNYTYTAPVSTKSLQMTARAGSTSIDPVASNDSASVVPTLVYPVRAISSAAATTRLCSGSNLTSFFECTRYPSSISSFVASLNQDQSIGVAEPGYSGRWSQNATRTSLKMEFFQDLGYGPVKVSEFNGMAIHGANCFHGLGQHMGSNNEVSPFELCLP